ncbi:magnesium transporter [Dichotomocladium elegans]|nr:magnesium transporter [Dichotomocladium elegans]
MSSSFGKVLAIVSSLFLAHSAYSTYEHRAYLKAVDQTEASLPIEITVECLLAAFVTLVGVVISAQPFKNILFSSYMATMTIDQVDTTPSFVSFNHRRIVSTQGQLERKL